MLKILLFALLFTVSLITPLDAFADKSIELSSYKNTIQYHEGILVLGKITGVSSFKPIELTVIDPDDQIIFSPKISFDGDGNFKKLFQPPLPSFKEGVYTIIASHEEIENTAELQFTVVGQPTPYSSVPAPAPAKTEEPETQNTIIQSNGITLTAEAIPGSDVINITGHTMIRGGDITFTVTSPNGNLISVAQITPSPNGDFSMEIKTGGPLWQQDGFYTVTVNQGPSSEFQDSFQVEIRDGVIIPEFGMMALLILGIGIVSIVVLTRKNLTIINLN